MPARLKALQQRILGYWNKFDKKQKRIIISVAAVVLIAFGILGFALSRTTYETLITVESQTDAAEVKALLDDSGYTDYKMSEDTLTFRIAKGSKADALLLLAQNNVPKSGYMYNLDEVTGSGGLIPPTEAERKLREKVYKEQVIERMLEANEYISEAKVELSIPETTYLVLDQDEESTASVQIKLRDELPAGVGETLARSVAYMIGNETTDHVIIVDTMGNIVFAGGTSGDENISSVNNQISARTELEKSFSDKVKNLLMSSNIADTVSVSTTLDVDFDTGRSVNTTYSVPEDMNQGYWSERHVTSSENTGESGGTPGTASNDSDDGSTTYEISADSSSSLVETTDEYYLVNQLVEENESKGGVINLENSSISVTLTKIRVYSEEELRAQGALDDMTYQEYQYQNSDTVIGTVENDMVDPVLITHVSKAAGIPEDQISVVANIIPFYQTPEEGFDVTNYLQLIVFVLIVLLLAFVVWRSTRRIVIAQSEPELSVEQLLAATAQEPPLDDIDLQEKSEARVAIEKFVDENPEAVALLLRSWLEADWD